MTQKGILNYIELPFKGFADNWDKIFVPVEVKDRLLSQALLEFTIRGQVSPVSVPLHGIIVLVGPPGTGKTSLARGLANRVAESLKGPALHFIEVEPHALASSALGRSQQAVRNLLQKTVAEHAAAGPLIVLLDEVETLAPDRRKLSLEANPVDVHRATDAVLASVDQLAALHHHLLFVATSNFSEAIDGAFLSRADLIEFIGKPDKEACGAILRDTIEALSQKFKQVKKLLEDPRLPELIEACMGLDAREIRKAIIGSCTFSKSVALNPNLLTIDDLFQSIRMKNVKEKRV
jgi:SpoVK/Ycf46/Vps4 family AAA+-type ATPase